MSTALSIPLSSAVGEESQYVDRLLATVSESVEESFAISGTTREGIEELADLYQQCHEPDWDGYQALPILPETYEAAQRCVRALPWGLPVPEVSAEPDGEVTLEWYRSPRRVVSISVSPNHQLSYAALFGASKVHGTETFHDTVPPLVIDVIRRVLN
ncbi:MAG: hypothetical protein ACI8T1_004606 [Verrucomicrobiales bacterium]|jgi:hypothetical protein